MSDTPSERTSIVKKIIKGILYTILGFLLLMVLLVVAIKMSKDSEDSPRQQTEAQSSATVPTREDDAARLDADYALAEPIMSEIEPVLGKGKYDQVIKKCESIIGSLTEDQVVQMGVCYQYMAESYYAKGDKSKAYATLNQIDSAAMSSKSPMLQFIHILLRSKFKTEDDDGQRAFEECKKSAKEIKPNTLRDKINGLCRDTYAESNKTTATGLWHEFNDNEVAAEEKYQRKLLAVEGRISSIETSPLGYPEVVFNMDAYGMTRVVCQFSKDSRAEIAKLKKGQLVTVGGAGGGFTMKSLVSVNDCWLIK